MSDPTLVGRWQEWHNPSQISQLQKLAEFTDPTLMINPLEIASNGQGYQPAIHRDFQSLGAVLLNNLAAKMSGMLFPVNQPNFRVQVSDAMKQAAQIQHNWDSSQLQTAVATIERKACERLYLGNSYTKLQRAIKLCIVSGECLVYRNGDQGNIVVWNRHSYAVRRDPRGRVWKILLKQSVTRETLPMNMEAIVEAVGYAGGKADLFTQVEFKESPIPGTPRVAVITHEVNGKPVDVSSTMPEHLCPLFVATWTVQDGEHYARGLVENFAGDFARLSALSENLTMYEISSLTCVRLVNTEAVSKIQDFEQAKTGDYVANGPGNAPGIIDFDTGNHNKIIAINQSINIISQRLAQAFMYSGMQRDSERTTATEVSMVAKEADQALGGAYSQLAQTLQSPLAYLTMMELGDDITSGLIGEHLKPSIVTGVQALARSADTQRLLELDQLAQTIPILTGVDPTLDAKKILERMASNAGVDLTDLAKSAEQLHQEAQAQAQQAQTQ